MRLLAFIGALAIIGAVAAAIYFFGGFYSVAENEDNPAIVDWALASVRGASVAGHATDSAARQSRRSRDREGRREASTPRSAASIVTEGRRTPIGPSGPKG